MGHRVRNSASPRRSQVFLLTRALDASGVEAEYYPAVGVYDTLQYDGNFDRV
jgi:hypothetical protein